MRCLKLFALFMLVAPCFGVAKPALKDGGTSISEEVRFSLNYGSYRSSLGDLWLEYENCKSDFKDTVYYHATSSCLKENPGMTEWDCEGKAEVDLENIVKNESLKNECGHLSPTVYPVAKYGIELPGAVAAISAINQGDFEVAAKILDECKEIDPINCKSILGAMNYYGLGVEVNMKRGIRLLESASSSGSKDAMNLLKELGLE